MNAVTRSLTLALALVAADADQTGEGTGTEGPAIRVTLSDILVS